MEVTKINGMTVKEALVKFSDTQVGLTDDAATRLHMAISGDHPSLWACSFSTRPLWGCEIPPSATVELELENQHNHDRRHEDAVVVTIPWTILYEGGDCNDPDGQCDAPEVKGELECEDFKDKADVSRTGRIYSDDDENDAEERYSTKLLSKGSYFSKGTEAWEGSHLDDMVWRPGPGGSLEVLETQDTAAAWAHKTAQGDTTAILRLASFKGERLALYTVMHELAALKAPRLLVDLRGNGGGHICHALELAYLISDSPLLKSPPLAYMDVRKSPTMDNLAQNQSEYYEDKPEYQFRPDNFLKDGVKGESYKSDAWYTDEDVSKYGGTNFSQTVPLNCEGFSSILEFNANFIDLKNHKMMSYSKDRVMILVDSHCGGTCATFARLMKAFGAAVTVKLGPGELGSFPGGMLTDTSGVACQFKAMGGYSPVQDFTLDGQVLSLPIAEIMDWDQGYATTTPQQLSSVHPDHNVPYTSPMADIDPQGALTAIYSSVVTKFAPGTGTGSYNSGTVEVDSTNDGLVAGMFFLGLFVGVCCVFCLGFVFVKQQEGGLDGMFGFCGSMCTDAFSACRSHTGYGNLATSEGQAHPPGSFAARVEACCNYCGNWRAWLPGMGSSSLQQQYQDLHLVNDSGAEMSFPMPPPSGQSEPSLTSEPAGGDWAQPAGDWGARPPAPRRDIEESGAENSGLLGEGETPRI